MEIAIFLFYLLLFSFILTRIPFYKNSGLKNWVILALFLLKVSVGLVYAQITLLPQYYQWADTWNFFDASIKETDWLLRDPISFIKDLFTYGYDSSGGLFAGENSYWNDLKGNVPVKLLAVMNVFTFKSYYADIILFNFLFLFGLVALYRVSQEVFNVDKWWILSGIFLFPSTIFWCSGIHKDGLILSSLGIIIYCFYRSTHTSFKLKYIIAALLCWVLTFSLRNYLAFAVLPALFSWFLSNKFPDKALRIYGLIYTGGIVLFFLLPLIIPALDFPSFIANKQHEFLKLEGGSQVNVPVLHGNIRSFISYFPFALDMVFFRPHITEIKSLTFFAAVVENIILITLVLAFIYLLIKEKKLLHPTWFFIFFSLTLLLISGYTVTVAGAMVRYRSLIFPFLATPILCLIGKKFDLIKK